VVDPEVEDVTIALLVPVEVNDSAVLLPLIVVSEVVELPTVLVLFKLVNVTEKGTPIKYYKKTQ
jgi:hypothetical protein